MPSRDYEAQDLSEAYAHQDPSTLGSQQQLSQPFPVLQGAQHILIPQFHHPIGASSTDEHLCCEIARETIPAGSKCSPQMASTAICNSSNNESQAETGRLRSAQPSAVLHCGLGVAEARSEAQSGYHQDPKLKKPSKILLPERGSGLPDQMNLPPNSSLRHGMFPTTL